MELDDAGSNGVSFICNNGTDLLAGGDTHWGSDNVWTSFVSCPGGDMIGDVGKHNNVFNAML